MVERVIAERQDEAPFNASEVSRLVNQRFRDRMKRAAVGDLFTRLVSELFLALGY